MENYTEEEKKQYNDYWNYYYGTQDHDYYADCMNQSYATEQQVLQGEGQAGQVQRSGNEDQITGKENQTEEGTKGDKKKGKKRKGAAQQERPEGNLIWNMPGLQIRVHIGKLFPSFLTQNICCGYSKEPSH